MSLDQFSIQFKQLADNAPFPWQEELYRRFTQEGEKIPASCAIPTGLGKTSVIAVWLIALATHPTRVPRRLAYVVNRRTVVDQTTAEVEKLRINLDKAELADLKHALGKLCALPTNSPLAVSTLRGAFADNREWSADPCRPAVVVGTVDLIGSRLLFSGYRAGYKTRPLYAGLLGQDTLIVHDEAHLEPAFQTLLEAIREEQFPHQDAPERDKRRVVVMQLSATTRGKGPDFTLGPADEVNPIVSKRLHAPKRLTLHSLSDVKQLPDKLAELALRHKDSGAAVVVFARNVKTVEEVAALLRKQVDGKQVQTLTGTMRGKERDELVRDKKENVFGRFLPHEPGDRPERGGTVYLVCTSAGEVGVNLSADHLVCDLTPFESMAQRLGRVNRFGRCADTQVDVVHPHPETFDEASEPERRTFALLERLGGNASPAALRDLEAVDREAAFSLYLDPLRTSSILFDAWSMTSVIDKLPGRPPVAPYLHGPEDDKSPETEVGWREEVERFSNAQGRLIEGFTPGLLKERLDDYPLKPLELLREPSYRVADALAKLAKKMPDCPVWLVDDDDKVQPFTLGELTDKSDPRNKDRLNNRLVLLPPKLGGLNHDGMLSADADPRGDLDVSSRWLDEEGKPRRVRLWSAKANELPEPEQAYEDMRLIHKIDLSPDTEDASDEADETALAAAQRFWWWYEKPAGADNEGSAYACKRVDLNDHNALVEHHAHTFAQKLGLEPALVEAVRLAGRFHDLGKRRVGWQRSIGNFQKDLWLAKSGGRKVPRDLAFTYRHEFGSLLDVLGREELKSLADDGARDVLLHLIAAHHGRARPHFSPEESEDSPDKTNISQHSRADADALAAETPRRFARLQRRFGRWGLAFLESLLRAADYAASANPLPAPDEKP